MGVLFGLEQLLECRTVREARQALENLNQVALNFVFADSLGNIGWQTTGKLPVRTQGESLVPYVVKDDKIIGLAGYRGRICPMLLTRNVAGSAPATT